MPGYVAPPVEKPASVVAGKKEGEGVSKGDEGCLCDTGPNFLAHLRRAKFYEREGCHGASYSRSSEFLNCTEKLANRKQAVLPQLTTYKLITYNV